MDPLSPTPGPHAVSERAARAVADAVEESPFKSRGGAGRIAEALANSVSGLRIAFRIEAAFRQELALATVLAIALFSLPFSTLERLLLGGTIVFALVVELLNSALEAAIDRISLDNHHLSKRAKDIGSAAVFLALSFGAICWAVIGWPVLLRVIS
jgi:diacylglycerol kinase (ATP)